MGYFILVGLQTVILPIVSGVIQLSVSGGDPVLVLGMWWAFWGVGTRLLVAGIVQLANPGFTSGIMGGAEASPAEKTVTRELAKANIGMGVAGVLALVPGWGVIAGLAGGVFLLWAGLGHIGNPGKNAKETFATWTDLVVGAVVLLVAVYAAVRFFAG